MSRKKFDYKEKMNRNRKRMTKRVAGITIVATLAISAPVIPSALSSVDPSGLLGSSIAYAQGKDLLEHNTFLSGTFVGDANDGSYTNYSLTNDGNPTVKLDLQKNYVYTVKFPAELAYLLNDEQTVNYIKENFSFGGYIVESDGKVTTINPGTYPAAPYVSINRSTNSLEFNVTDFHKGYNLTPYTDDKPFYSFKTRIRTDFQAIDEGEYILKTALTEGSADLDTVSGAPSWTLDVKYDDGDGEEPDPEEPGDGDGDGGQPTDPEEPGDGDGDGGQPTDPEEPGDGDGDGGQPTDPEEPGDGDGDGGQPTDPEEPGDGDGDDGQPTDPEEPGDGDGDDGQPTDPEEPGDGDGDDGQPTDPEEPGDGDGDGGQPTDPEEPGDGDGDDGQPTDPEEPGDGDEDGGQPTDPEEPGDGDGDDGQPTDPEEPGDGDEDDGQPTDPEEPGDGDGDGEQPTDPEKPGDGNQGNDDDQDGDNNQGGSGGQSGNGGQGIDGQNNNGGQASDTNQDNNVQGERLPDTATNTWTYGLAGAAALLLGFATKVLGRFRRTT